MLHIFTAGVARNTVHPRQLILEPPTSTEINLGIGLVGSKNITALTVLALMVGSLIFMVSLCYETAHAHLCCLDQLNG